MVVDSAEQFSVDVSLGRRRPAWPSRPVGKSAFPGVVMTYIVDCLPRVVRAWRRWISRAVDVTPPRGPRSDLGDGALRQSCPAWPDWRRDRVTTEIVGAAGRHGTQRPTVVQVAPRGPRVGTVGGSESLYEQIELDQTSVNSPSCRRRSCLDMLDAMIWLPATIKPDVVVQVRGFHRGRGVRSHGGCNAQRG